MADQVLTRAVITALFQALTVTVTGLDKDSDVRNAWPTDGSPGVQDPSVNVVFLRVAPTGGPYIQQRDTDWVDSGDGVNVDVTASYTRVHEVYWTFYGPSSSDLAETLRNALYSQTTQDTLAASNLYMILDVPAPIRVPELFNGQWWERADLSARFNEDVQRYTQMPYLETAQITIQSDDGEVEVITP